jgi:CheY-like chemotaxis protein
MNSLAGMRILVVDDNDALRYVLVRWLSREGAEVVDASSAREAIEVAEKKFPTLAVVDLAMPGQDGFYLVSKLRALEGALGFEIPIVAISSYGSAEVKELALAAGFDAFVNRPTESEVLIKVLRAIGVAGAAG